MSNTGLTDRFTWALIGLSIVVVLFAVALFTELGQLLNLPSSWLYAIHPHLGWTSVLLLMVTLYIEQLAEFSKQCHGEQCHGER